MRTFILHTMRRCHLQAVAVLGLTVGIHELGHFLAAVTRGIHVTKFSIGFGPTLLKWQVRAAAAVVLFRPLCRRRAGWKCKTSSNWLPVFGNHTSFPTHPSPTQGKEVEYSLHA